LVAFYTGIFGFRTQKPFDGRSAWLAVGDGVLMLEVAPPEEPEIPRGTLECTVFATDVAGRDAFRVLCTQNAVPLDGETAFTTYVRDPDGRRVGVSHYPLTG
jgi:catechol 2,3-dioxygenase-like lactoylglutathione lyase family enzyme